MKTSRTVLAQVIADGVMETKIIPRQIAAYLIREHRTSDLASLLRDIQAAWAARGYVEVIAESPNALTAEARLSITAEAQKLYPKVQKIVITERRNPDLIAGVRLTIIDYQLDLTARHALQRFTSYAVHGKEY